MSIVSKHLLKEEIDKRNDLDGNEKNLPSPGRSEMQEIRKNPKRTSLVELESTSTTTQIQHTQLCSWAVFSLSITCAQINIAIPSLATVPSTSHPPLQATLLGTNTFYPLLFVFHILYLCVLEYKLGILFVPTVSIFLM